MSDETTSDKTLITAEEFAERLPDLPDGGRWMELEAGEVASLDAPDVSHGTIVLNLTKSLGAYLAARRGDPVGYACFDLGLIVARRPDTVRRPAISFFTEKELFAESDHVVTETVPGLVIETATTKRSRRGIKTRLREYHRFGVEHVWVADPADRVVHTASRSGISAVVSDSERLSCEALLPGFSVSVAEVFAEPKWWLGHP